MVIWFSKKKVSPDSEMSAPGGRAEVYAWTLTQYNTGGHSRVHQFGKHRTFGPESIDPLCLLMRTPGWNVRLPTDTSPPPPHEFSMIISRFSWTSQHFAEKAGKCGISKLLVYFLMSDRVAKFDLKVGSGRTTKIKNLAVLVIILVVLILLP